MIRLTLSSVPPSLNKYLRMHWAVKRQLRTNYQWELTTAFMATKDAIPEGVKIHVIITIYHPRLFDPDNLYGACKPLIDAMRDCHFIKQDSPKWLRLKVEQVREKDNPRTEIELEED